MSGRTWIKLFCDNWFRGSIRQETPLLRAVWVDLLALAGPAGHITLPGGFSAGYTDEQLAGIFRVSLDQWLECKARLAAHPLGEKENRIHVSERNVIKIINWSSYQSEYEKRRDRNRNLVPRSTRDIHADKMSAAEGEGEGEGDLEGERKRLSEFDAFWNAYPRRIGKQVALNAWERVLKNKTYQPKDLLDAAMEYAEQCKQNQTEEKFILHPATFLNKDRWKDYCFDREPTTRGSKETTNQEE